MSHVGYVAAGWAVTGFVFGAYWVWIVRRTRRAERSLPVNEAE